MARLTTGARGHVVHRTTDAALGELELRVLDVGDPGDLDVIHEWVQQPWAGFWGLGGHSRDELAEVYRFVDSLATHHAFLLRRDGVPVALVQTYEPEHDPVGECYEVREGDVGLHFFLGGRGAPVAGLTTRVALALAGFVFEDPAARRIVVEPDVGNAKAVALLVRLGFTLGPLIDLGHKRAQLAFAEREAYEAVRSGLAVASGTATGSG